jgi:glycerol-3-phosphate dehydrogenase (NAD(P)+)
MTRRITILGSGAMATACACLLCEQADQQVTMWTRSADNAALLNRSRENQRLLPGVAFPESLTVTADFAEALRGADFLVVSIPTKYLRDSLAPLAQHVHGRPTAISVVKGIENGTLKRPSEIIAETLPVADVAVLSGPSHAEEVGKRLPASVVAAASSQDLARCVQEMFTTDRFRVYSNADVLGVELAGALKNVIGIAAGICDGLRFGDNAKSALMTRGIVEISRFGQQLGAAPGTFSGLAGVGDLITTCMSPHGRNRLVGQRLGRGETLHQITTSKASVAEGVNTAQSVHDLSRKMGVEMPICEQVYEVLFRNRDPLAATNALMMRPPREE